MRLHIDVRVALSFKLHFPFGIKARCTMFIITTPNTAVSPSPKNKHTKFSYKFMYVSTNQSEPSNPSSVENTEIYTAVSI